MIADFTSIRRAVEMELKANYSETPVKFENVSVAYDTPEYIATRGQASPSEPLGLGEDAFVINGMLFIDIFTPVGTGTQRALTVAGIVSDLIANRELSGIQFMVPSLYTLEQDKDAQYYQHILQIEYRYIYGQDNDTC